MLLSITTKLMKRLRIDNVYREVGQA